MAQQEEEIKKTRDEQAELCKIVCDELEKVCTLPYHFKLTTIQIDARIPLQPILPELDGKINDLIAKYVEFRSYYPLALVLHG